MDTRKVVLLPQLCSNAKRGAPSLCSSSNAQERNSFVIRQEFPSYTRSIRGVGDKPCKEVLIYILSIERMNYLIYLIWKAVLTNNGFCLFPQK